MAEMQACGAEYKAKRAMGIRKWVVKGEAEQAN
jgi:hypothetical protein